MISNDSLNYLNGFSRISLSAPITIFIRYISVKHIRMTCFGQLIKQLTRFTSDKHF